MQIYGLTCLYLKDVASSTIKNIHASCHTGGYMKKVIGVAVAASLVAGMAFAEVSVSLNARLRSNMYHVEEYKDVNDSTGAKKEKIIDIFDLDGGNSHGGSGAMSDTLGFNAKTDYAGITLELAPKSDDSAAAVDRKYNAWLKFGDLKFSFGTMDSRFINRYNVTAGESGLLDSNDIAKYGIAGLSTAKFLKDANNFSAIAGTRYDVLIADYTFADVAGGKLLVKAALFENIYKGKDDTDKETLIRAGFGFEADYQNDSVAIQGLYKAVDSKQSIFGVYVEPKLMKELTTVVGFSYGKCKKNSKIGYQMKDNGYLLDDDDEKIELGTKYGNDVTAYALDVRFGYKVSDALKISTVAKYEYAEVDKTGVEADTALSLAGEVSYIINDKITAFFDAGYYNNDLDGDKDSKVKDSKIIRVRPGVKFTAGKNAAITAAFQYDSYNDSDDRTKKTEYSIPVIFRVKL